VTIELTTIGSGCVELEVTPAALPEAQGGATLWVRHWRGTPLEDATAYTLTEAEAKQLVCDVARALSPWLFEETLPA
jgi:hypothetical protein